jgi:hypothetical protein
VDAYLLDGRLPGRSADCAPHPVPRPAALAVRSQTEKAAQGA